MVIIRKSQQTELKEKLETLEEALRQRNSKKLVRYRIDADFELPELGIDLVRDIKKKHKIETVIAHISYDQKTKNLLFGLTDKKYLDIVKEFCESYERKTLKDEPIIEY